MNEWMNEWMNERMNEWIKKRMNELINEWILEWVCEKVGISKLSIEQPTDEWIKHGLKSVENVQWRWSNLTIKT